jgi:hypothetical protein
VERDVSLPPVGRFAGPGGTFRRPAEGLSRVAISSSFHLQRYDLFFNPPNIYVVFSKKNNRFFPLPSGGRVEGYGGVFIRSTEKKYKNPYMRFCM